MAPLNRRQALGGAAAIGVGAPLLAACGGSETSTAPEPTTPAPTPSPTGGSASPSGDGTTSPASVPGALVAADAVPVGGGVVLPDSRVVVTQPEAGTFAAFSAVCTHNQCLVGSVEGGEIVCPCHGSHFSITDGSVTAGPAPSPLPEVAVQVTDGQVVES
ncbi:Rieske (2Fe-2S) protein [Nocardioides sp. GY 10113]|uniref:Rieske (2Fe-2S) protein n=1 Tax=Nocardioides sp. GY 10113 TaxID=2569761 RepID=UPI0010A7CDD9|nr:Rieske (2Fe-2S) protein [Nocardioides sp. GY 10113]TIC87827.1 Rieske (2Fe-2S) protein [Nocardioides sp. GY 10113]